MHEIWMQCCLWRKLRLWNFWLRMQRDLRLPDQFYAYNNNKRRSNFPSMGLRYIEKTSNNIDCWTQYFGWNAVSKEQKQELQFLTIWGYQVLNLKLFNLIPFKNRCRKRLSWKKLNPVVMLIICNWTWLNTMTKYEFWILIYLEFDMRQTFSFKIFLLLQRCWLRSWEKKSTGSFESKSF